MFGYRRKITTGLSWFYALTGTNEILEYIVCVVHVMDAHYEPNLIVSRNNNSINKSANETVGFISIQRFDYICTRGVEPTNRGSFRYNCIME